MIQLENSWIYIFLILCVPFVAIANTSTVVTYEKEEAVEIETIINEVEEPIVDEVEEVSEEVNIEELIRDTFPEEPEIAIAIAQCESGLQADAYNTSNWNGSVDRGVMQINSVHDDRLKKMDLDPWEPEDNIKYARVLYDEQGWQPWVCYSII